MKCWWTKGLLVGDCDAVFKLYSRWTQNQYSDKPVLRFTVQIEQSAIGNHSETINGKKLCSIVRKVQLYPLQAGLSI